MEVIVGKTAGFCPGVSNAVIKTEKYLDENNNELYCLGELIHNPNIIERLNKKGLKIVESIKDVPKNSKVIIRAHGVDKKIYEIAKENNIEVLDLTCPKVIQIHKQAEDYKNRGYYILLIAEKKHPETIGTFSFCGKNASIIQEKEDIGIALEELSKTGIRNVCVISQTTFSMEKFDEFVELIKRYINKNTNLEINKTICNATKLRQEETKNIAKQVDLMLIIGGKKSSNTNKLYEISLLTCNNAMFIENLDDLYLNYVERFNKVGIMAGASTPQELIDEVIKRVSEIK